MVLCLLSLASACVAVWTLGAGTRPAGKTSAEWTRELSELQAMSPHRYAGCRASQLLDRPDAAGPAQSADRSRGPELRFDGTTGSVWDVVAEVGGFEGVACRPDSWLGLGSRLDALPPGLVGVRNLEGNPLWPEGTRGPGLEELADAELRLWDQVQRELGQIAKGNVVRGQTVPPPRGPTTWASVPVGAIALWALAAAVLLGLAVWVVSFPDRVALALGVRWLEVGSRRIPRASVRSAAVRDGRLRVELAGGEVLSTPVLADPDELGPLVDAWTRVRPPEGDRVPADVAAHMASLRSQA